MKICKKNFKMYFEMKLMLLMMDNRYIKNLKKIKLKFNFEKKHLWIWIKNKLIK